jgi:lipopolysaccharide transport system permease protein
MPDETVYSAEPLLTSPRRFASVAAAELRIVPSTSWRVWRRDLRARHRQAWLGYVWLVVPPLAIALTWVYLDHAGLLRFGDTDIPYLAYVLTGTMLWLVFTDALQAPLRRLSEARPILAKARLPHETWMLAGLLDVLLGFAVRVPVLAIVLALSGAPLSAAVLLVPLGVVALAALGMAVGLVLSPIGLLYEDIRQGLTVAIGLLFFLTPVIYPWPAEGAGARLVELNPVTPLLVETRGWLTGAPGAAAVDFAAVFAGSLVLLTLAWVVYRLAQPHLVVRL